METSGSKKGFSKDLIYIGIIVLLLGFNIYQFFAIQEKTKIITVKEEIIKTGNEKIDEMALKITAMTQELDDKIAEIERLGGRVDSLIQIKNQLEKDKRSLRNAKNVTDEQLAKMQSKMQTYEMILKEKDKEIERLQALNKDLYEETVDLKEQKNNLSDTINDLKYKDKLTQNKINQAAVLKAYNVKVAAINKKGKEEAEGDYRNKNIETFKIRFSLDENKLVDVGTKTIYLRIQDPEGAVLYDELSGSGRFMLNGSELFYTTSKDVLYDYSAKTEEITYKKTSDLKSGKYTVELYTKTNKVATSSFIIK